MSPLFTSIWNLYLRYKLRIFLSFFERNRFGNCHYCYYCYYHHCTITIHDLIKKNQWCIQNPVNIKMVLDRVLNISLKMVIQTRPTRANQSPYQDISKAFIFFNKDPRFCLKQRLITGNILCLFFKQTLSFCLEQRPIVNSITGNMSF